MADIMLPARALLADPEVVLPALPGLRLINPLVWCNADRCADRAFTRWIHWVNVARDIDQAAVRIGRYQDACVSEAVPYAVLAGDHLVLEHVPAQDLHAPAPILDRLLAARGRATRVAGACLFACHPGVRTWGHWLADMLPKIVLAEAFAPGKFRFVVPGALLADAGAPRYAAAVRESLAAYGIAEARLLALPANAALRFDALHDLADLMQDGVHPGAIAAMQNRARLPAASRFAGRSVGVPRRPGEARPLANGQEVGAVLAADGVALEDVAALSFTEQACLFRDAAVIVGDLGSNLAGAVFCRPGARLLSIAPAGWRDSFMVNRFQRQDLLHADVRGASLQPDKAGHAPFQAGAAAVREGLSALRAATHDRTSFAVAGRVVARRPGQQVWRLDFGSLGNAAPLQQGTWSAPEALFTWSEGPAVAIVLPGGGRLPPGDFWLEVDGCGHCLGGVQERTLAVAINGGPPVVFDHDTLTHVHVPVPGALARRAPDLRIDILHPDCRSPFDLDGLPDKRPLGFRFARLRLLRA